MRMTMIKQLCTAVLLCVAVSPALAQSRDIGGKLADAPPGSLRLFVSGALREPVLAVKDRLEQVTGRKLFAEVSESRNLQREIEVGQPFEAALLTTAVIKDLVAKGKIVAGSDLVIAEVRVGVSVRGDAPKLDIATPDGLKAAILGAQSVRRYYGVAASTPTLEKLFVGLDLEAATKDKMVHLGNGEIPQEAPLAAGQYELIINLISAIKPMPGWHYLGPIPEQFQIPVVHVAGVGADGDRAAGEKVMQFIKGPEFAAALKASGVTGQ